MSLLALRPSHRGVRLHTFEPEDRGYTSTPTKIGGHCLDHVRNGFTVIRQLRNKHSASVRSCGGGGGGGRNGQGQQASSRDSGGGEHETAAMEGRPAEAFSTTLDTSMGRFGGLSAGLVLRLGPADFVPHHHRLYPTLAEFPPDTLAPRRDASDGFSCQQQQQQQQRQAYDDPKWHAGESDEVDPPAALTIAPRHGGNRRASPPAAAADDAREEIRAVPYRDMATTAATGHSGALMAILLSRLAAVNPGDAYAGDTPAAAAAAAAAGGLVRDNSSVGLDVAQPGSATALITTDEVLRRPPADSAACEHGGGGGGGGSWAWKARVDPLPVSSRLKRYDFVRELGSGSHGTLLLVRKRPLSAAANSSHAGAGRRRSRGGTGGRSLNHGSIGSNSSGTCSFQPGGNLRVLKESHFLPEAVNEARLLLLAGGGGGGGGGAAYATGSGFGYERQMEGGGGGGGAGGPETYGGIADTGDDVVATATAVRDGGAREGRQRGEVVKLHDFFVETVGHRSLAFLELEYCEGGDLASLILGSRAGGGSTAGAENSAATATPTAAAAPAGGGAVRDFAYRSPAQPLEGLATAVAREESTGGGGGGNAGDFLSGGRRNLGAGGGSFDDQRRSYSGAAAVAAVGQDARARLAGLPAARIGRVALGLCEGLQRLHERGILHRDLKPANVLLTKTGAVRVADLGVSTRLDPSRPLTENAAGTIPFMAPEVRKYLLGSKVAYSGKADVWAIGALVYAMAVGDPAPAELATEPRERLVAAIGLRTGSEALSLVAHRALDPDPSRRPSVHQMTSMLQSCCEREGWLSQHKHTPGSRGQGLVPRARL